MKTTCKVLVSGGPVHAHLDAVKILTNRFKGGRIAELAEKLSEFYEITYLTAKGAVEPNFNCLSPQSKIIYHTGYDGYRDFIKNVGHSFDAIVLGAAVVNLIPVDPWKGKFPSHDYEEGDIIPINFQIAPRVINMVHEIAPKAHLFGFKLLQNVPHEELIKAAYDIVLDAHATAVFANDALNLNTRFAVTKERGVHKLEKTDSHDPTVDFINDILSDKYYASEYQKPSSEVFKSIQEQHIQVIANHLKEKYADKFKRTYGAKGYVFGSIAVRIKGTDWFLTTSRGKTEIESWVLAKVNHSDKKVFFHGLPLNVTKKATLNAPLLDNIFKLNSNVESIVHYHELDSGLPVVPYAPPGTFRDANREMNESFEIKNHGVFELLDDREYKI